MNMLQIMVHKQSNIYQVIGDVCTINERVWERSIAHSVVVDSKQSINIKFFLFNFIMKSTKFIKCSQIKDSIIVINDSILLSIFVLFNFLKFNILVVSATNLFFKCHFIRLQIVLFDEIFFVVISSNCDCFRGIVSYDH